MLSEKSGHDRQFLAYTSSEGRVACPPGAAKQIPRTPPANQPPIQNHESGSRRQAPLPVTKLAIPRPRTGITVNDPIELQPAAAHDRNPLPSHRVQRPEP